MGKRKPKTISTPTTPAKPEAVARSGEKLRLGLLAATVGVWVMHPIVVNESAVLGDGLVLVMLFLGIGSIWAVSQARRPDARIRFSAVDAAVLLLLGLYCLSGLIAIPSGNVRSIVNMIWQWIGLGTGYFLLRQLVRRAVEARVIVAVMIAMAVSLASYGLYQYCWDFPQMRAEYAQDPEAAIRAAGEWYKPGSPEWQHFKDRVQSPEPLATFALTNSLAGFLAPWLIVTAGLLLPSARGSRADRFNLALILLMLIACFILTKSRTAWVAVGMGGLGLGLWWKLRERRIAWKWVAVGAAVILLLVGLAIAAGGLDSQVVSEAGKSMKYRFEYWQSTARMIGAEPWFGTGPGRYQDVYCRYKLPQASEEPTDPHNFLFEIAATAGLFALAAMVAVLVLFVVRLFRRTQDVPENASGPEGADKDPSITETQKFIYLGALCGYLASFFVLLMGTLSPNWFVYYGALPIGALALWALNRWVRGGRLSPMVVGIAWGVLLVNLLAAGGIGFPGVAASFWILLALGLGGWEEESHGDAGRDDVSDRFTRPVLYLVALVMIGLVVANYFTAYRPVLASQSELKAALRERSRAEEHLRRAAEADPWSARPWSQLSSLVYQQWEKHPTIDQFDAVVEFSRETLDRVPAKATAWFVLAERSQEAYRMMGRATDQKRALDAYRRAVGLYPNQSLYRARWALALHAVGNGAEARREAQKSLELDRQNPHAERRLTEPVKKRLEKIVGEVVK